MPAGRTIDLEYTVQAIGTTLANLTLNDVIPAPEGRSAGDGSLVRATLTTFDGLRIEVRPTGDANARWLSLEGSFDPTVVRGDVAWPGRSEADKAAATAPPQTPVPMPTPAAATTNLPGITSPSTPTPAIGTGDAERPAPSAASETATGTTTAKE